MKAFVIITTIGIITALVLSQLDLPIEQFAIIHFSVVGVVGFVLGWNGISVRDW